MIGLLTGNVRDGARLKLSHYELFDYFSLGGYGDHHFDRDDVARESLSAVREHLNGHLSLDDIWVIGDTPLDVRCARAIGVRVAVVATGWHSAEELRAAEPDIFLPDLTEPAALLERWSSSPKSATQASRGVPTTRTEYSVLSTEYSVLSSRWHR